MNRIIKVLLSVCTSSIIFLCVFLLQPADARNILVFAPHPDDEALATSGIIYSGVAQGDNVTVVIVTNGDYNGTSAGYVRLRESISAMSLLGLGSSHVIFMGYGDGNLMELYKADDPSEIITSIAGETSTYGDRGLGGVDYHTYITGQPGDYNAITVSSDIESILLSYNPTDIYVPTVYDDHGDHKAVHLFVVDAIVKLIREGWSSIPVVHETLIHAPCETCDGYTWPLPTFRPDLPFPEPPYLDTTSLVWEQAESVPVPSAMRSTSSSSNLKYRTIDRYPSQLIDDWNTNYMFAFCKSNEISWRKVFSGNIALSATVDVSSEELAYRQAGSKAVDGIVGGDPYAEMTEWATQGELAGAWIRLTWGAPQTISRIVLYDRPNDVDQVVAGTLHFSDGSSIAVGTLPNNGVAFPMEFSPKTVSWVEFAVDAAVGENIGLAEIEVFGATDPQPGNTPPVIGSGPTAIPSTITDLQTSQMAVTATDDDGDPLTYAWSASGGTVSGAGASAVFTPPRVTSTNTYTVSVTVRDGKGGAATGNTSVTVQPGNTPPEITSGPTATPPTITDLQTSQLTVATTDADSDPLTYEWSSSGGTISGSGPSVVFTPPRVTTTVTYTVNVTVRDGYGGMTEGSTSVTVQPGNTPPVISSGPTATPSSITDLQTSQLAVTATDDDGDPLTYAWSASGGTVSGAGPTAVFTPPRVKSTRTYTVSVTVRDGKGGSTKKSVTITVARSSNLARNAAVAVSSENVSTGQLGVKAVDGVVDGTGGVPGDPAKEWATLRQLSGAWITLTWGTPQTVKRVILNDRPNLTDRVRAGTLLFSDGSTISVSILPNNGADLVVDFSPRTVTWVKFTITKAVGSNIGLAEFQVY